MAPSVAWHPDPRTTTSPYVAQQADHLRASGVDVVPFRLTHLTNPDQVVHVHWPEHLARSHRRSARIAKPIFVALFLGLLRLPRRARLVWTVHNLAPHQPARTKIESKLEQAVFATIAQQVDVVVTLVAGHEAAIRDRFDLGPNTRVVHIPEGVEHPVAPERPTAPNQRVNLLAVGALIPYKGYVEAAQAIAGLHSDQAHLHIVGSPTDPAVVDDLRSERFARSLTLTAERVSDAALSAQAANADAVLVPHRNPFNSGTPYWALTHRRPVIMVESDLAAELAAEFGDEWIYQLPADFGPDDLAGALDWVRSDRPVVADSTYSWAATTAALERVYTER